MITICENFFSIMQFSLRKYDCAQLKYFVSLYNVSSNASSNKYVKSVGIKCILRNVPHGEQNRQILL